MPSSLQSSVTVASALSPHHRFLQPPRWFGEPHGMGGTCQAEGRPPRCLPKATFSNANGGSQPREPLPEGALPPAATLPWPKVTSHGREEAAF